MFLEDLFAEASKFMDSGGSVLWAIVVLPVSYTHLRAHET